MVSWGHLKIATSQEWDHFLIHRRSSFPLSAAEQSGEHYWISRAIVALSSWEVRHFKGRTGSPRSKGCSPWAWHDVCESLLLLSLLFWQVHKIKHFIWDCIKYFMLNGTTFFGLARKIIFQYDPSKALFPLDFSNLLSNWKISYSPRPITGSDFLLYGTDAEQKNISWQHHLL